MGKMFSILNTQHAKTRKYIFTPLLSNHTIQSEGPEAQRKATGLGQKHQHCLFLVMRLIKFYVHYLKNHLSFRNLSPVVGNK